MYMLHLFDATDPARPREGRLLREGIVRIGRDPGADWTIADPDREISRHHCALEAEGECLFLRCTGANGVFNDDTGARLPDAVAIPLTVPATVRIGRYRLVIAAGPHDRAEGAGNRTLAMTRPLGDSTLVPDEWADAAAPPRRFHEGSLLEAFCEGAGLDASLLSHEEPAEIMRRAGAAYRQMVLGIGDLMSERDRARARYQLTRTTISGGGNNPFKWAPTQRLAIDLLLGEANGFLSGAAALRASFADIKRHLVATFSGLHACLRTAIDSFDPGAIEQAVADRPSLLRGRAALNWQEASTRFHDLCRQLDEGAGGTLDQAFAAAYDEAERKAG